MILCKHCGNPVNSIETNCFDTDGSDSCYLFKALEAEKGVAEIELPTSWCGEGLTDSEMMERIKCTVCGKFPFSETAGINTEIVIKVVCFEEDSNDENA